MTKRGAHEGSIYQRQDGRWAASVHLGYIDGKRQRKTFLRQDAPRRAGANDEGTRRSPGRAAGAVR